MNTIALRRILVMLMAAGMNFACASTIGAEDSSGGSLSVTVYNIQFLPGPGRIANKRKQPEYRAGRIGEEMSKFDIVALNEAFDDEPRENVLAKLKEAWGEDYHAVVHPRPEDGRFNGGLVIASRLPIIEWHHTYYTHYSKPEDYGVMADGFAAKGVLHARIQRSKDNADDYVDVFTTHLEARADELRPKQYPELAAFVKEHSDPNHPTIICGDMNTNGNPDFRAQSDSQYSMMIENYTQCRPGAELIDVWPFLKGDSLGGTNQQESPDIGKRIDYIFVSNPKQGGLSLKPTDVRVNMHLDPQVVALSDHSAVEADFTWER